MSPHGYKQISVADGEAEKNIFVQLAGKTNGAHHGFVSKLQGIGHRVTDSLDQSDYLLVFCPVVSRVGTDISEALEKIPDGKPTILVVMHHTFNPDRVIAPSRRLVDKANITTVDCLFYEDKLLKCERNDSAWSHIQSLIGVPRSRAPAPSSMRRYIGIAVTVLNILRAFTNFILSFPAFFFLECFWNFVGNGLAKTWRLVLRFCPVLRTVTDKIFFRQRDKEDQ